MRCRLAAVLPPLTLAAVLLPSTPLPSAETVAAWPQWRGPSGQGYTDDADVPLKWGEQENLLWKTDLPGSGNSTPVVWGDRLFLTCSAKNGDERLVVCVRVADGEILWKQTASTGVPAGRTHQWNGYASASCTTDGRYVYAFFGTPGLFCYDFDGKLIWKHSFGVFVSEAGWGTAASPFLYEDLIIQNCDNDGPRAAPGGVRAEDVAPAALVALDRGTGQVRWTTPRNQGRGFGTPRLMTVADGRVDLVLNGPDGLFGYDPKTGKERWRCLRHAGGDQQKFGEPMPVNDNERLYVASGRPGPYQIVKLPGDGDVTKSHVVFEGVRRGHRDVSSPLLVDGLVYAADDNGRMSCIELKTGKEIYADKLSAGGAKSLASPVLLRGKILWLLDDGTAVIQEPGRTFKVAGVNKLPGGSLDFGASPAVAGGKLFLRSQTHLYCIADRSKP